MNEDMKYIKDAVEKNTKNIEEIKSNHLVHISKSITELRIEHKEQGTDLKWLKKTYWIIAGASISGLIAGLINLLMNYK